MTTEITFVNFDPDSEATIAKEIASLSWMLPHWMKYLHVRYEHMAKGDKPNDATIADYKPDYMYWRGKLTIYARYFAQGKRRRLHDLRHELIHGNHSPVYEYADEIINRFIEDENMKEHLRAEFNERVEQYTEHMAICLSRVKG